MSENNQKELKQRFLKEKIIDDGFAPEEFAEFLEKRKVDGCNIDNWTLQELIWEVEEYKSFKSEGQHQNVIRRMTELLHITSLNEIAANPETKIHILK